MPTGPHEVTRLLLDWGGGNKEALDVLLPSIYNELRRLARAQLRLERPGHTLQATALVHEAYVRLIDQHQANWQNRAQFFGLAAELIRRILVDHARARKADKRGGGAPRQDLEAALGLADRGGEALLLLAEALSRLAEIDARQSRIVELRYFGGLGIEETATALNLSPATVKREWSTARAWLFRQLRTAGDDSGVSE